MKKEDGTPQGFNQGRVLLGRFSTWTRFVEGVGFQWYPYEHPDEASRKLQVVGGVPVYPWNG